LGRRLDPQSETPHEIPEQWLRSERIFSIEHEGVLLVPAYLFDAQWQPLPGVAEILQIFDGYFGWYVAGWFESKNSYLGGPSPREVLALKPDAVVGAAKDSTEPVSNG
jgi:hypothetical protein